MTDQQKQRLMEIAADVIFNTGGGAIEIYNRFTNECGLVKAGEAYAAALRLVDSI